MFLLQFVELLDKTGILLCILLDHREKDLEFETFGLFSFRSMEFQGSFL